MSGAITQSNAVVTEFFEGFFGYGNPRSPIWLIGPEESGSPEELPQRANFWSETYKKCPVVPAERSWFDNPQKTWDGLSKLLLWSLQDPGISDHRIYRRLHLASEGADHALMEASPVPRRKATGSIEDILELYGHNRRSLMARRMNGWANLFRDNNPRVVVVYGQATWWDFKSTIEELLGGFPTWKSKEPDFFDSESCRIISCRHPTNGCENKTLMRVADLIREVVNNEDRVVPRP